MDVDTDPIGARRRFHRVVEARDCVDLPGRAGPGTPGLDHLTARHQQERVPVPYACKTGQSLE